jgi:HSP20 family molecular chaperone IbpA
LAQFLKLFILKKGEFKMLVKIKSCNNDLSDLSSMDRLLSDLFDPGNSSVQLSSSLLRASLSDTPENVILVAEVPGVEKNDIKISYLDNSLSISVERKNIDPPEDSTILEKERVFGKFLRTFRIPVDIDPDKISAENKDGMLIVKLVKTEKAKPKEIQIN